MTNWEPKQIKVYIEADCDYGWFVRNEKGWALAYRFTKFGARLAARKIVRRMAKKQRAGGQKEWVTL